MMKYITRKLRSASYRIKAASKQVKWKLYNRLAKTITVSTRNFKIKISAKDEAIGKQFYFSGEYSLTEIDKAFLFLKRKGLYRSGTLLDIGANIGHVTLHCLATGLADRAICIEPDKYNFRLLQDNLVLNGFDSRATSINVALASVSGKGSIILSGNNFGDHRIFTDNEIHSTDKYNTGTRELREVELITIDELALQHDFFRTVSFICIDVQGFELETLKGGSSYFDNGIPMLFEVDPYLLEKKGSDVTVLHETLSRHYNYYVDIQSDELRERDIGSFPEFYQSLVRSGRDYTDILLFRKAA